MKYPWLLLSLFLPLASLGQSTQSDAQLTLDRIFSSNEFRQDYLGPLKWIKGGDVYVKVERNKAGKQELVSYESKTSKRKVMVSADQLIPQGERNPIYIEDFTFSPDESRLLFFTNSARVWRANTRGDYWMYDLKSNQLSRVGSNFPSSSLMFAKFSKDNSHLAYVQDFNIYVEKLSDGKVIPLTQDGGKGIINGTFDWAYEEEFGKRDGFMWDPSGKKIAFWQLDASKIGTFYMINNTDSIYSRPIPIQYPKVGQDPSSCRVAWVSLDDGEIHWIPIEGSPVQNYIPGMQWISKNKLLIQQLNRLQNTLTIWQYDLKKEVLTKVYTEKEDTWVDIQYPDVSSSNWGENDLPLVDGGKAFLRLSETGDWRHLYKIYIDGGKKELLSPGDYDVASLAGVAGGFAYVHASPENSTQRYLYRLPLNGKGEAELLTLAEMKGINTYNVSPHGKFAIHRHSAALVPATTRMISLPSHHSLEMLMSNQTFNRKIDGIDMPEVEFITVDIPENLAVDARIIKPVDFDPTQRYPVLFHVYGEPWRQVAEDSWIGLWNIFLAQQGFVVIDIDNRGTPCLKGSQWRKSIYRQIGRINIKDLAETSRQLLKLPYIDTDRVGLWGWSGGGSSTLNLMFQYPQIYQVGVSVAPVANQLLYDNIYQERYMGLPQENKEDFMAGSPITHAENLEGELLLIHGTADDNVHYQGSEMLINELIRHNKQFRMMAYPNRSHGIYEGPGTRRHLYGLITEFLLEELK